MGDIQVQHIYDRQNIPQQTTTHRQHLILSPVTIIGNNIYFKNVIFLKLKIKSYHRLGTKMYPVYWNKYRTTICWAYQEVWAVKMTKVMWTLP
jgi:hypothetical protein